jgi:hypothetical protein
MDGTWARGAVYILVLFLVTGPVRRRRQLLSQPAARQTWFDKHFTICWTLRVTNELSQVRPRRHTPHKETSAPSNKPSCLATSPGVYIPAPPCPVKNEAKAGPFFPSPEMC